MHNIRITLATLFALGGASAAVAQQSQPPARDARGLHARKPAGGGRGALLRGLTLSDAEKASLKNIRENQHQQTKALREQYKPQHEAMRDARQRGDTTALRALRANNTAEREATRRLLTTQRAGVRAALSSENQAKFDANIARMEKRLAQRPDTTRRPFARRPGPRMRP
jgi:Spy/CpxP family protein refolding chaperone